MISVLLPVYNSGPYLSACLDSVLAQTQSNWELLAVDDYSTDGSWAILRRYAWKDARIRPMQNQGPKGIIPALRLAFGHSRGRYITRMDSDDLMPAHKLQVLRGLLQARGPGWVATGKVRYFSDEGLGDGFLRYQDWLNGLADSGRHYEEAYRECVLPSPAWMALKEDVEKCGAFEPDTYPEDYDLWFRFYEKGMRIAACQEVVHLWRDHPARTSRNSEVYADYTFLPLKLHYFLKVDYRPARPLVVWGAGRKGKETALRLQREGIRFHWVCDTPGKVGKDIYGIRMQAYEAIAELNGPQVLVLVAAPDAQAEIKGHLQEWDLHPGKDFFFFC
ncbi:MAG: glycosyltransferase family 2 protein [Phaeodactylibacter sp.]|nr:glycosyltransferase family 2 protein [Phaeodactylibacter sp.]MCB9273105.1 glycosyltransferase family 2 protein [Lewinellaceae bacterium]